MESKQIPAEIQDLILDRVPYIDKAQVWLPFIPHHLDLSELKKHCSGLRYPCNGKSHFTPYASPSAVASMHTAPSAETKCFPLPQRTFRREDTGKLRGSSSGSDHSGLSRCCEDPGIFRPSLGATLEGQPEDRASRQHIVRGQQTVGLKKPRNVFRHTI